MSGQDRTPTMSNNTTPSPYVVSASSAGSGAAYLAFDKADSQWAANTDTNEWIKFDFGSALWACDEYRWTVQGAIRGPNDWTFEGSNDDSNWTTLDTQTNITWIDLETKTFTFSNTTKYRYYRWSVATINGGTIVEADEIAMYATDNVEGGFIFISY